MIVMMPIRRSATTPDTVCDSCFAFSLHVLLQCSSCWFGWFLVLVWHFRDGEFYQHYQQQLQHVLYQDHCQQHNRPLSAYLPSVAFSSSSSSAAKVGHCRFAFWLWKDAVLANVLERRTALS